MEDGFFRAGNLDELRERRPKNVILNGVRVVLVKVDGEVLAFENNCPHQHFSVLHEGVVEGCSITCPMHGWTFDLHTGRALNGNGKLRKADVVAREGIVWVKPGEPDNSYSMF